MMEEDKFTFSFGEAIRIWLLIAASSISLVIISVSYIDFNKAALASSLLQFPNFYYKYK